MSTLETLNTATNFSTFPVKKLDEFKTVELESNQYLVRKIEKGTGLDSKGVIIPAASAEDFIAALDNDSILAGAVEWFNTMRGEVCKERIAEGKTSLIAADFDSYVVGEYLAREEAKAGRISKERIASWFDAVVSQPLTTAFREKLGASIDNDKMLAILASYKGAFTTLAKREPSLSVEVISNLEKSINLIPVGNPIAAYCAAKLKDAAPKQAEMLAL